MEFNRQTKMAAQEAIKAKEAAVAKQIDRLVASGEDQDLQQRQGCAPGCFSFFRRGRSRLAQEQAIEVAVFGQNGASGNATHANARLEKAATQMENHAEQLYVKASASRSKAKALMGQGKKAEAMAALKRAKGLEKQAQVAASTHAAIEQQKDFLESSALQREVATALSASVAATKKKTRGLLEKAESAVDDSAELRDAVEDISEVMGGLNTGDQYDEDDLLEELELMAQEGEAAAAPEAAVEAEVEPQAIVVGIDPSLYPSAPRRNAEAKQKLLSADSAAAS